MALVSTGWFFRAVFVSRFADVPGDLGDSRLLNFLLEHGWLWLRRDPLHRELWSLPIYYPADSHSFAYADLLLSFAPPYWLARAAGADPHTAYQLWILVTGVLSSLAVFALLRWGLRVSRWAAAVGASLATFAASRLFQIQHAQLWPIFYPALGLLAAVAYAREASALRRRWLLAAVGLCVVLQFYGGFYNGVFMLVLGAALLAVAASPRDQRQFWRTRVRTDAWLLATVLVTAAALLAPLAIQYSRVEGEVGGRNWGHMKPFQPRLASWLYHPPAAPFSGWEERLTLFNSLPNRDEHAIGLGYVTPVLLVAGLIAGRRRQGLRNAALAMAIVMVVITLWPGGFSLWKYIARNLPGLSAARVTARLGLLLPLLAAAAFAVLADTRGRRSRPWIYALGFLALAEQSVRMHVFDKRVSQRWVADLASRVDPAAAAFVVSIQRPGFPQWIVHLDAMWATTLAGRPTVNGYTGSTPPGWGGQLWVARSASKLQRERFTTDLAAWLSGQGVAPASTQWIELDPRYRRGQR